jgi:hypothetical protein
VFHGELRKSGVAYAALRAGFRLCLPGQAAPGAPLLRKRATQLAALHAKAIVQLAAIVLAARGCSNGSAVGCRGASFFRGWLQQRRFISAQPPAAKLAGADEVEAVPTIFIRFSIFFSVHE